MSRHPEPTYGDLAHDDHTLRLGNVGPVEHRKAGCTVVTMLTAREQAVEVLAMLGITREAIS